MHAVDIICYCYEAKKVILSDQKHVDYLWAAVLPWMSPLSAKKLQRKYGLWLIKKVELLDHCLTI